MFGNSLDNLGKSTGECKNKHSDKFPKLLKIFGNLRKSSEIFGKNRKMSQSAQDDLRAFFDFFMKSSEVIGNLQNYSDVFGNLRKISEICRKVIKITFQHF